MFEYIKQQDADACNVFDTYCTQIAVQIMNMQYILDREVFAIGGGISAQPIVLERILRLQPVRLVMMRTCKERYTIS
ncbi:ROK family protein [Paenibacillus barcinonensis]|uniref:ROK family protein n=1 Tax=Paenibacillus barcinonensis TaxID=198119 RepID=UPI001FCA3401|nr:hypothetical protein [Paenibacillus barcinonensis]